MMWSNFHQNPILWYGVNRVMIHGPSLWGSIGLVLRSGGIYLIYVLCFVFLPYVFSLFYIIKTLLTKTHKKQWFSQSGD